MTAEEFPDPQPGPSWEQLRIRLACSAGIAVLQVVVFWEFFVQASQFVWPPIEPVSQWVSFLLVSAGSFVFVSGLFGTLIADQIYKRYFVDGS